MKNYLLLVTFILLPIVFGCAKLDSLVKDQNPYDPPSDGSGIRPRNVPNKRHSSSYNYNDPDNVVISIGKEDMYIGSDSYSIENIGEAVTRLIGARTPDDKNVYIYADTETPYLRMVQLAQAMREKGVDKVRFVVRKRIPDGNDILGFLEVKLSPKEGAKTSERPNPLSLMLTEDVSGIELNGVKKYEDEISKELKTIFEERTSKGIFREGTNEVEKTVYIKATIDLEFGKVASLIDFAKGGGAEPVILQIDDLPKYVIAK